MKKGLRLVFIILPTFFHFAGRAFQEKPDFGPDGLAGLSKVQVRRLSEGEIVLPNSIIKTLDGRTLIEAALIFDRPLEEVWRLLSRTEDQFKYLDEVQKIVVVSKSPFEDRLEFTTKVLAKTFVYRQCHHFDPENFFFQWELDPTFPGEIKELTGFWRLYPFVGGKTLGRYGSRILLRFIVPRFIQTALAKNQLPFALRSVKKYVDSGGNWDKTQDRKAPGSDRLEIPASL